MSYEPAGVRRIRRPQLVDHELPLLFELVDLVANPYPHSSVVRRWCAEQVRTSRELNRDNHLSTFVTRLDHTMRCHGPDRTG